jgi:molecular chaperone GrpE
VEEIRNEELGNEAAEVAETAETAAEETETVEGTVEDTAEEAVDTEEAEETEASEEEAEGEEPKKKGLFGKKKKDKRDTQIEELTDRVQRQMAEFDNFRKRSEKEKAAMFEVGAKSVVEKILPVIDNFERGLGVVPEDRKEDPFIQGMEKVYKQMLTTLESIGVQPIEAVGKEFDPNFHNAVMHVEDEEVGENIVVEEFQKGYTYRDSVVRYSMVKVAN